MKKLLSALIKLSFGHRANTIGTLFVAVGVVLIPVFRVMVMFHPDMHPLLGVAIPLALPGLVGFGGFLYVMGLAVQVCNVTPINTPGWPGPIKRWNRMLSSKGIEPSVLIPLTLLVISGFAGAVTATVGATVSVGSLVVTDSFDSKLSDAHLVATDFIWACKALHTQL